MHESGACARVSGMGFDGMMIDSLNGLAVIEDVNEFAIKGANRVLTTLLLVVVTKSFSTKIVSTECCLD